MGMKTTLTIYFFKWIMRLGFVGVSIIIFNIGLITSGLNNNVFLPANEPIKQAEKIKAEIEKSKSINTKIIPSDLDYAIFNKHTSQLIHTNMTVREINKVKKAYESSKSGKPNSYLKYDSQKESLMIHYTLRIQFKNIELRKIIPNPEVVLAIISILFYGGYLIINIRRFTKLIIEENQKLINVARKIKEKDLNIEFPTVTFNEYKDVMSAMQSLSEALIKSIQNEMRSKQSKAEQISYLIHDIKIPLTVIKGNIELLELEMNQDTQEHFHDITNSIKQIEVYIQEVIDINLNNKELKLNKVKISVSEFINKLEVDIQNISNIKIIFDESGLNDLYLYVDINLIKRGIINILINGRERTPKNEYVQLIINQTEKVIQFIIIDKGPGFSKEALKKGTELFYTENSGRINNSHYGLGLTFTERVVKQHNGTIKLRNNENKSGEVELKLPILTNDLKTDCDDQV